jgi:hypothetical protein
LGSIFVHKSLTGVRLSKSPSVYFALHGAKESFPSSLLRDKILREAMRCPIAIPVCDAPLLKRFHHGRPDRGRRPSC